MPRPSSLTGAFEKVVSNMLNRLHGQPESYDKKYDPFRPPADIALAHHRTMPPSADNKLADFRSKYRFGRTLGAGTYGIVREADSPSGKVAVKIILKKNVKGNERMVYDELEMLQRLKHDHIVRFVDWFESRVSLFSVMRSSRFVGN